MIVVLLSHRNIEVLSGMIAGDKPEGKPCINIVIHGFQSSEFFSELEETAMHAEVS
jgi:hypothetical protein